MLLLLLLLKRSFSFRDDQRQVNVDIFLILFLADNLFTNFIDLLHFLLTESFNGLGLTIICYTFWSDFILFLLPPNILFYLLSFLLIQCIVVEVCIFNWEVFLLVDRKEFNILNLFTNFHWISWKYEILNLWSKNYKRRRQVASFFNSLSFNELLLIKVEFLKHLIRSR